MFVCRGNKIAISLCFVLLDLKEPFVAGILCQYLNWLFGVIFKVKFASKNGIKSAFYGFMDVWLRCENCCSENTCKSFHFLYHPTNDFDVCLGLEREMKCEDYEIATVHCLKLKHFFWSGRQIKVNINCCWRLCRASARQIMKNSAFIMDFYYHLYQNILFSIFLCYLILYPLPFFFHLHIQPKDHEHGAYICT